MKAQSEYIIGITLESGSLRKYKITVMEGEKKGKFFYKEIFTPKISEFKYGKPRVIYCIENKVYQKLSEVLNKL